MAGKDFTMPIGKLKSPLAQKILFLISLYICFVFDSGGMWDTGALDHSFIACIVILMLV